MAKMKKTQPEGWRTTRKERMQSFEASVRLDDALTEHNVPHEYIVCEHSGHGLQNDNKQYKLYMEKVCEYLEMYMPVD